MNNSSLRRQLMLPYVLLVLFVSAAIAWVSCQAGEEAVSTLSQRVLNDMASRIGGATEQHLAGAVTVLNTVHPDPAMLSRPQPFSGHAASLEERLWIASGLFIDVSNHVYFGGADGSFIGVNRVNKDFVELYLREPGAGATKRQIYSTLGPGDRNHVLRTDDYDPRSLPWYGAAANKSGPVWSSVYSDYTSREPTITLARAVHGSDRALLGVIATDVTLKVLTDFLRTSKISGNSVAFVMDGEGFVVATSGDELPFRMVNGAPARMRGDEMDTPLIREAYAKVLEWKKGGGDPSVVVLLKGVTDVDDVIGMEEKIRCVVEEPVQLDHAAVCVGVSIGWALFPEDGEDVDALLKIADKRMFDTKRIRKAAR